MAELTVAICMYNAEKYVADTLECLLNQTMQDFDLLILNDCSTDNSVTIVEEFFKSHPRQYRIVSLEKNGGLCAGRRWIEDNVDSKYLLFVDADDCPKPTLVEKLYNKISSDPDLIAVGCYLEYMDSEGKKMNGGIFLGETSKEGFCNKASKGKLIFMQPTAIYDRKVALSVGGHNIDGFPDGKPRYRDLCEDLDLWCRMSDLYIDGKAIVVVPEVLCRYRKHEQALSANSIGMLLRMRHIKSNLKRRRRGERDLTFIDFMAQMPKEEKEKLEREAKSVDSLRMAYYSLRKGKVLSGVKHLWLTVYYNPKYIIDKIKHNLIK